VRFLNKRLDELQVVDRPPDDTGRVYFGARVTLEDAAGEEQRWRIVGPDEFDLGAGKLSMDSPMARALMGKTLDDEVLVDSPSGKRTYYVTDIEYDS
jgi:transcription elongation factor GreB